MTESNKKPTSSNEEHPLSAEKHDHGCTRRLPAWLKRPIPKGPQFEHVIETLKKLKLETVCGSAACPNRGECFSHGTATFMIMGANCTRNCRFCAVSHGTPTPLESDEPQRLAQAVAALELKHVVITSVTRDDLPDGGAVHFALVIQAVRQKCPKVTIEVLTPDFQFDTSCLDTVIKAQPDVFNHNVETTRRLTPEIRSGADYERSLAVLNYVAEQKGPIVKSGFMLGLGETDEEIRQLLHDLRSAGVTMLTIGQYLRPSEQNRPVAKFYPPEEFDVIRQIAEDMGFNHVAAGPFVRSSYHAEISLQQQSQKDQPQKS
ncbi:MAG: lipoyl synthase [Sedimentisphaerales bacterium]|nr:lipoyl synthase [Sedimentisphaerales bacterium]